MFPRKEKREEKLEERIYVGKSKYMKKIKSTMIKESQEILKEKY